MTPKNTQTSPYMDPQIAQNLGRWLLLCCAMVAIMVLLGGATRLTESGLSIVDWRPVTGILPPFSIIDWQVLFDAYKQSPEFKHSNFWMSLDDFKTIYWLEYLHRLWGRFIGLVFLLPLMWFWLRGYVRGIFALKLVGVFLLGGLQALMGWYMVQSGLVDQPSVSQYRLAAHLLLAFLIYGYLFWLALRCLRPRTAKSHIQPVKYYRHTILLLTVVLFTVIAGAFVAGLDAGLAYNTFPLMDGRWIPNNLFWIDPWWINFFENTATVQFAHRVLGMTLIGVTIWLWLRVRKARPVPLVQRLIELTTAVVMAQAALGVATLLHSVPIVLGVAHQGGSLIVFTLTIWILYELGARPSSAAANYQRKKRSPRI